VSVAAHEWERGPHGDNDLGIEKRSDLGVAV
jgi:hypothetical protein